MKAAAKSFDCVEMKREAQAKVEAKYAGLSERERHERLDRELATAGDPLARWWRKACGESGNAESRGAVES